MIGKFLCITLVPLFSIYMQNRNIPVCQENSSHLHYKRSTAVSLTGVSTFIVLWFKPYNKQTFFD